MPSLNASDSNYEATFADLAYARLRDKAPSLLNYMIGFQMIDKNEDETHSVGVFAFKVGNEWVYCPVFFINGELKGHELMYVKNQDAFVPMTEQWVNYILNRRPKVLGKSEDQPRNRLGLRQPDFDIFARAPYTGSKAASFREGQKLAEYMHPFLDVFASSPRDEKFKSLEKSMTLDGFLGLFGKQAAVPLFTAMRKDRRFGEAILNHYNMSDLVKAADDGSKPYPLEDKRDSVTKAQQKNIHKETVRVVTDTDDCGDLHPPLTDAEREKIFREKGRYAVRDKRKPEHKTIVHNLDLPVTLNSPPHSGFFEVVVNGGKRKRMLVLQKPMQIGWISLGSRPASLVIDTEAKNHSLYANNDILTSFMCSHEDLKNFVEKLPKGTSLRPNDIAVLINAKGDSTQVFRVDNRKDLPNGSCELSVRGECRPASDSSLRDRAYGVTTAHNSSGSQYEPIDTLVFTGKDANGVAHIGSTCFVPTGFKAFVLKNGGDKSDDKSGIRPCNSSSGGILLGSYNDALSTIKKEAAWNKLPTLRVRSSDWNTHRIEYCGEQGPSIKRAHAMKVLVEHFGMDGGIAEGILDEGVMKKRSSTYILKKADYSGSQPQSATFQEPSYGNEYGIDAQIQHPMTTSENLGQNDNASARDVYRNDRYVDDAARQQASAASDLGQKEVLDTAVISGLVKTMDSDNAVDSYIGDLLLGLDRVGRILFMYYWHNDKFKERYGQQDMIELEDNLRNVFKNLGELTLFLKQKTIEPDADNNSEAKLDSIVA